MPNESSSSVKITWFDTQAVWTALRRFVCELARSHPEVEQVIVFGSFVRGQAVPGSDVDLLIVLNDSPLPFGERLSLYRPQGRTPVDVDVFPYLQQELEEMLQQGNFFLTQALREGVVLFDRGRGDGMSQVRSMESIKER